MNKSKKRVNQNIVFTLLMVIGIAITMFATFQEITNIAVEDCYERLWRQTNQLKDILYQKVETDTELLSTTGDLLMQLQDVKSEEACQLLAIEGIASMVRQVEFLLADGSVITKDGVKSVSNGVLDFEKEAALDIHVTGRLQDPDDPDTRIVYLVVPVKQGDVTAGILYGEINMTSLQEYYRVMLGDNGTRFYLFEGESKDTLIATMYDNLDKIDLEGKEVRKGDDAIAAMADMTAGKSGQIAFHSHLAGEYLYCVYVPAGVNDWMVMLGTPQGIAFKNVAQIQVYFFGCAAMVGLILLIYFTVLLFQSRKMASELEEQYHSSQEIRRIQENLFHSVLKPEKMEEALRQTAEFLTAKRVCLSMRIGENPDPICYSTLEGGDYFSEDDYPVFMELLKKEDHISFLSLDELAIPEEEKDRMRRVNVHNGMTIILRDMDNRYRGIMFAVNLMRDWEDNEPLEWLRYGFAMAMDNIEAFERIKDLGSKDQLTGSLNRNSYQKALECYEKTCEEGLSCVYVDVDGLHELNNQLGHAAGDEMLMTVAQMLRELFGNDTVYRIGGDEFVVFCCGTDKNEVADKQKILSDRVIGAGYHISMGTSTRKETPLVCEMVRLAESRMYETKRQFYREMKNGAKVRETNRQLEATLLEKRDLDVFCSVLSYKYVGVYIVNLSYDTIRAINTPEFFAKKLEEAGGKFSGAIADYAETMVMPGSLEEMRRLMDYDWMYRELAKGECPEVRYQKADGTWLLVKIYPTPDFDEFQKECIWTFEVLEEKR